MNSNFQLENKGVCWILLAKGIGMILVVIGHFHPESSPSYWSAVRGMFYTFHMPLFFILSGYLFIAEKYSYGDLIRKKVKRLLYPFLSIALLFFIIKTVSSLWVSLDHPVNVERIINLFTDPIHSYMPLLWYVHALFFIFLIYPVLKKWLNIYLILSISVSLGYFFSDTIVVGKALYNFPFFVAGVLLREYYQNNRNLLMFFVSLITYLLTYLLIHEAKAGGQMEYLSSLILGLSGSLLVISVCRSAEVLNGSYVKNVFQHIGYYSMTIYLFHTLFESTVRILFLSVIKSPSIRFEFIAALAIFSGVLFPFLLEKYVFRKSQLGKKYVLGIS